MGSLPKPNRSMMLRLGMIPTLARAIWHALLYVANRQSVIAPPKIVQWRRRQCEGCQHSSMTKFPRCGKCLCFIELKITLSSESCPIGRWKRLDGLHKQ